VVADAADGTVGPLTIKATKELRQFLKFFGLDL